MPLYNPLGGSLETDQEIVAHLDTRKWIERGGEKEKMERGGNNKEYHTQTTPRSMVPYQFLADTDDKL